MNKIGAVFSIVFALFIVGIVIIVAHVGSGVSYAQQSYTSNVQVSAPVSSAMGLPAITPHTQKASFAASGSNTSTPTYSIDDAVQYVNTHPMPDAFITGPKPAIVKAAFLSSQEVSKLMKGESTGVPNDTLLCYVELRGAFTFYGGSGTSVTYHTGVEVFDAYTGNLLIAGGQ